MKHPVAKSIGWALVYAARLHRSRIGERLASMGLFPGQEQVLQALASGEPTTMGELADLLRVKPPTASKTVARLAAQGLVERRSEPGDARIIVVSLTKEGAEKVAAIDALWRETEAQLLDDLDSKDRKRLRKHLRKMAKNLSGKGPNGRSLPGDEDDDAELDEPVAA
ncbi:MarR family winged helix-turn-helix transcriptional regulator [Chelatococcus asaccharovorans]|uniref:MarR family transcriptional regulator n=1 Tax=Chelatococcus asaccharovorans TaxID=28210 RepID=A0A2V3TZS8_9HYPH|nr:MarR family winged helix-turn-helix transcriptional regulator [Chelatococcus asaccharovorans]MBS7704610.1 winged helix-turn-helix transcriptional regulator [Chelatococcus asaccharovorans]PXW54511.1 MarR family transcriptional regulator [Chelatococcus asaccharovorans]CAH1648737.1 MarR family transcriptional regulator [Chelatococcus asaccharovorans]CAH1687416.1 MarR family transcriptional regulator [Chelatococcus asaccharovorans]